MAKLDFDGDIIFSTNDSIINKGSYDYGVARPLYYKLGASGLVGTINNENVLQADIRGLNSKVGTISNKAASLYAMLKQCDNKDERYKMIYNSIIALGQIVGMEIDRIKTGIKPTIPMEWKPLQVEWKKGNNLYDEDVMITSEPEAQGIYRHNDLVPDIKPYFMRYNYNYLDRDIKKLRKVCNQCSVINYAMKLDELEIACNKGEATEEMQSLYRIYRKTYPVNDADCVVNHISHLFESVHFDLHKQIADEGRDMLKEFTSEKPANTDVMNLASAAYDGYRRFLRMETKRYNSNRKDGAKVIKANSSNNIDLMREYYRKELYKICGNYQNAFDHLVYLTKGNEKIVWDILDDHMLKIVGKKG